jgi:hypothetical protein
VGSDSPEFHTHLSREHRCGLIYDPSGFELLIRFVHLLETLRV